MANKRARLVEKAKAKGVLNFSEAEYLLEQDGFRLRRVSGSHHIYKRGSDQVILVKHGGKDVKPYVVKQMLKMIEKR